MGLQTGTALDAAANDLAKRAWVALSEGRGLRLSYLEVLALHEMEGDGDWWQSFNPLIKEPRP
jgi:hypothetical protein